MSKVRKSLAVCIAIAVIALIIQIVNSIIGHEPLNIPILVCTGIVPVTLIITLLLTKQNDKK